MALITFYDTECNSLDKEGGTIQELAWATFDIDSKRLVYAKSFLLNWNMHYEVSPDAFEATGLSKVFCERMGDPAPYVFSIFLDDVSRSQFVGGHNHLEFDDKIIAHNIRRSLFDWPEAFLKIPRIDTMTDCPYPKHIKIRALKFLALEHGYVMSNAHQALADVMASAHIFFSYPFEQSLAIAETPMVDLYAYTDYHDQVGRDLCYKAKFRWNKENRRFEQRTRKFFLPEIESKMEHVQIFVVGADQPATSEPDQQLSLDVGGGSSGTASTDASGPTGTAVVGPDQLPF